MKVQASIKFHNRFDIEVRDKDTNELKQKGMAENIILDRAYTRVCNFNGYFTYIHFGSGTGGLSPTRTTLFSKLGAKSATTENTTKAFPVSSVTKKIILAPEEYVDTTITEVGVSETTSAINTHALITDAEGNPLSINKTALDVVTIYATIFVELQDPSETFQFFKTNNNSLVDYFLENRSPSAVIYSETEPHFTRFGTYNILGEKTGTVTVDVANRKRVYTTRFGISEANGDIRGHRLGLMLKVAYPTTGIYQGYDLENVVLGEGDNINKNFVMPSFNPTNIVVKQNSAIASDYVLKDIKGIEYQDRQITGGIFSVSEDGETLAVMVTSGDGYLQIRKRNSEGIYTTVQTITNYRGKYARDVVMSGDAKTLLTSSTTSPAPGTTYYYSEVYKLNEETNVYEKKVELSGNSSSLGINYDGSIVSSSNQLYKVNEITGNYQALQTINGGSAVRFSKDSTFLVISSTASPHFRVYKLNETTGLYEQIQTLTNSGTVGRSISISDDKSIIVTGSGNAPYVTVYEYNIATELYEKKQDLGGNLSNVGDVSISADNKTLVVGLDGASPWIISYYLNEDTGLYELNQEVSSLSGSVSKVSISNYFPELIIASTSNIRILKFDMTRKLVTFNTPPAAGDAITADYRVDYIPKTTDYVLDVTFELIFGEGL